MEALWIVAALVGGLVSREIGLPPLVGFLAAGFALRAAGVEPDAALDHIAHLGVLLLLFTVGLKVRVRNLVRIEVWGTALIHVVLSAAVLSLVLHLVFGLGWNAALIVGTALSLSSTVVAAKVLEEKVELRAFHGRVAIGILIVQDLVAVALLSVAGSTVPSPWAVGLIALIFARPLLNKLMERVGHAELLILFGLLLALVIGGSGFEHAGLSPELGALLLGALLADHERANELGKSLWALKEVFLVAFFVRIGMSGLPDMESLAVAAVLALILIAKSGLFFALLTRFCLRARSGFLAGIALATYSEFALIVVQLAVTNGILDEAWLVHLALTVALSFVIAAPLNRASHLLWEEHARGVLRPFEREQRHPDDAPMSLGNAHVVVVGVGRIGTGAYDFLRERGLLVAGLDSDPAKIESHRAAGRRVLYADAEDPGLWERLRLDEVDAVLLTMPDIESKARASDALRKRGFGGMVSATSAYPEETVRMMEAGCSNTFNHYDDAGAGFAEHALTSLEVRTDPARNPASILANTQTDNSL